MNFRMISSKRAFENLALELKSSALPSTDLPDSANQKTISRKIIRFTTDPNHFYNSAIPSSTEGRFAIVT
jgi:hypothetical protein